jgi:PIN domain nuclease of toxin-antitoxin system
LRLVLDTHVLLWWSGNDPALPATAGALIQDPENVNFVSAVNLWETWLKESLGKLRLPAEFQEKLASQSWRRRLVSSRGCRGITATRVLAAYGDFVHVVR